MWPWSQLSPEIWGEDGWSRWRVKRVDSGWWLWVRSMNPYEPYKCRDCEVSSLRDFANFALADVMVYLDRFACFIMFLSWAERTHLGISWQDDQWRERIREELLRKMAISWALKGRLHAFIRKYLTRILTRLDTTEANLWKLFSERTSDYSGEVKHGEACLSDLME